MLKTNLVAMIWNPSDISCYSSFAVPSLGNKSRLRPKNWSWRISERGKWQLVPKNSAMVYQRNSQHISITSVLSNLETSLDIPTCDESSIISLAAKGFQMGSSVWLDNSEILNGSTISRRSPHRLIVKYVQGTAWRDYNVMIISYIHQVSLAMVFVLSSQQTPTIIWYINAEKFRYDNYLAISAFSLLSHVVGVTAWLDKHCNFFGLALEKLDGPPPY